MICERNLIIFVENNVSEQLEKILASMGSSTVEECVSTFVARGMEVQGVGRLRARLNVAELLCVAKLPTTSWEKDAVDRILRCRIRLDLVVTYGTEHQICRLK